MNNQYKHIFNSINFYNNCARINQIQLLVMEDIDETGFEEDPDFVEDKDEIYSDEDEYIVEEYLEACPVKRKHVQLTLAQKLEIIEVCCWL